MLRLLASLAVFSLLLVLGNAVRAFVGLVKLAGVNLIRVHLLILRSILRWRYGVYSSDAQFFQLLFS